MSEKKSNLWNDINSWLKKHPRMEAFIGGLIVGLVLGVWLS